MRFLYENSINWLLVLTIYALGTLGILASGGSGNDENSDGSNIGWISISSSDIETFPTPSVSLRGTAFISSEYTVHQCVGLACIFGWYDNSYPGVDVFWINQTTNLQGTASSRYGTATDWEHYWYADVPITSGLNQIQVRATDPDGNDATASLSVEYIPTAPSDLQANTNDGEITLSWSPVQGATAYTLYWSTIPGEAFSQGVSADMSGTDFLHDGLLNGTTYYYAITSRYLAGESEPSAEISATVGAPLQPKIFSSSLIGADILLSWNTVATADTYSLYWANEPGVTKKNGTPISGVISPYLHGGLSGLPYYYVVTALNGFGESLESEEAMGFPPIAPPPPDGLVAIQRLQVVDLTWNPVPGVFDYEVYRCHAWAISTPEGCEPSPNGCYGPWERIGTNILETQFVDWTVDTFAYWYYVTARNPYNTSLPSYWAGLCVEP